MTEKANKYCVLVVSGTEAGCIFIKDMLPASAFSPIVSVSTGSAAKCACQERIFDIIIINAPLSDESGRGFAVSAAANTTAGIVLMVKSEQYAQTDELVRSHGVLTISKPIRGQSFLQMVNLAAATRERLRVLESANETLRSRAEDARLIGRAKCILVAQEKMTEQEAHRYIEKQAMDQRLTKREVADSILQAYQKQG